MVGVGQMTNNRQRLSINAGHDIKNLKIAVGWMASGELEAVSNIVTYGPVVNSLTRSRLWRWNFVSDVGPYDRYSVIYRGTYDKVLLTDDVRGVPVNPKRFNSLELQGKYKTRLVSAHSSSFTWAATTRHKTSGHRLLCLPKMPTCATTPARWKCTTNSTAT